VAFAGLAEAHSLEHAEVHLAECGAGDRGRATGDLGEQGGAVAGAAEVGAVDAAQRPLGERAGLGSGLGKAERRELDVLVAIEAVAQLGLAVAQEIEA
jgi:hypothetical protein